MYNIFIDGSVGTTGLRIASRLADRNDINLISIPEELRKDNDAIAERINASDVTFLCLPDAAAKEAVTLCTNPNTVIIDASTAHRTADGWAYGFAELGEEFRNKIINSKRIANPGCHASGFNSIVYPLVKGGFIAPDYPVVSHSITGYSGGGKGMIASYEDCERDEKYDSPAQYGLTAKHKHLPEMKAVCTLTSEPAFNPIVSSFYSGMAVTVPLFSRLMAKKATVKELHEYFTEYYKNSRLISVMPLCEKGTEDGFLYANTLSGKDSMQIIVCGNDERPQICALFCNLGKGASGAAIQNMNLVLGADECAGLIL